MGYFDEQQRIVDYVTHDGMIIELTQNKDNLKSNYQVLETYADSSQLDILDIRQLELNVIIVYI